MSTKPLLFWIMPSCDVVPDSTDLGTDRPNLPLITAIGDRFEPIQILSGTRLNHRFHQYRGFIILLGLDTGQ